MHKPQISETKKPPCGEAQRLGGFLGFWLPYLNNAEVSIILFSDVNLSLGMDHLGNSTLTTSDNLGGLSLRLKIAKLGQRYFFHVSPQFEVKNISIAVI